MRDTVKEQPVGFENERRNIFDPEEDEADMQHLPEELTDTGIEHVQEDSESNREQLVKIQANSEGEVVPDVNEEMSKTESDEKDQSTQKFQPSQCARSGCTSKPRFDSMFCSDSCGVSALELDLLRSFQESSDIHPSVLRN
jgi:hypothetical protein